jgi:hypothetical protein
MLSEESLAQKSHRRRVDFPRGKDADLCIQRRIAVAAGSFSFSFLSKCQATDVFLKPMSTANTQSPIDGR